MVIGGTKVVQVTNIAPQATKDQMQSLFGYLGKIEDIRLYPTLRDVSCPVQSRICYIKFADPATTGVAQHMTNTVFIDRALIVLPISSGEIPDEYYALEMTKNGTIVPGLCLSNEPKLPPNVTNSISGVGQDQVILTFDPLMESKGLPAYPPLPANYDCGKIEEIRRTLLISNLDSTTTAEDIMKFFQPIGEIKYLRSCTRVLDNTIHWLVEFSDQHCISAAFTVNGTELNGTAIKITHATQGIVKPQTKTNEAAQREIEEAMSRVKEAQSLISAAIDPVIGMLSKDKDRNSSHRRSRSRSRDRGRRRRGSRSRSRSRRSRSRQRSSRRRSRSRSRDRKSSQSKDRGSKRRSRSRKRSKSRANRSRSPSSRNRRSRSRGATRRDRDRKRSKSRDKRSKSRDRREKDRKSRDKSKDRRGSSRDRGDRRKSSHSPSNRKSKTPPILKDSSSSSKGRSKSPKDRDRKEKKDSSVEKSSSRISRSRSHSRRSRSRDRGRDRDSTKKDGSRGRSKRSRTSSPRTVSRRRSPGTPTKKDRDKSRSRDRDRRSSSKRDEKRKDRSRSRSKVTPRNYEEEEKASSYDSVERKLSAESDRESERAPSIAAEPENPPEEKESDNMDISNSP